MNTFPLVTVVTKILANVIWGISKNKLYGLVFHFF